MAEAIKLVVSLERKGLLSMGQPRLVSWLSESNGKLVKGHENSLRPFEAGEISPVSDSGDKQECCRSAR